MGPTIQADTGRLPLILFVGGTKHGDVWQPAPLPSALIVDGPAPERQASPDQVHLNLATGEQYALAQVRIGIQLAPPPVPPVVYEAQFYMFTEVRDVQTGMALVQDAVLRRHFLDNGHTEVRDFTVYIAQCPQCEAGPVDPSDGHPLTFPSAGERATWMRDHIDTTGHTPTWSNQTPTPASQREGEGR